MKVFQNHSLQPYNSFGLSQTAETFIEAYNHDDILEALEFSKGKPLFILGGGSNVLLTRDVPGVTLHVRSKGSEIVQILKDHHVFIKTQAGEIWHRFVLSSIEQGFAGVENLSLIPGSIGAAPMQNIGAYGVELEQVFHSLEAIHISTGELRVFKKDECEFGYRTSIFKTREKGNYIISSVTLRLSMDPVFNTSYGSVRQELETMGIENPGLRDISNAIIRIRSSKLPDPKEIGNAGSFFKNPVISPEQYDQLLLQYPDLIAYPAENGMKLAAGWLIEKAGWKGFTRDHYGVHKNQALVLVNYGGAQGKDIYDLSEEILLDIHQKFGVVLEREVNVI